MLDDLRQKPSMLFLPHPTKTSPRRMFVPQPRVAGSMALALGSYILVAEKI